MNQTTDWGRYLALMEQLLALELDDPRQQLLDLRAAAVHHHRVHAHQL